MNTKLKYLLGCAIFMFCVGIGYLVTPSHKVITNPIIEGDTLASEVKPIDPSPTPIIDPPIPIPPQPDTIVTKPVETIHITDAIVKREEGADTYSLKIKCTNPNNLLLKYEIPILKKENSDGYFTMIPGCKSRKYKVNVKNSITDEVLASKEVSGFKLIEEKPVDLMSSAEFQALLLNEKDNSLLGGKHPKVAKSIALFFEGLRDDDKKPGDILAVREKIAYKIWSSAKVLSVGYDEKGKINSAKIQPVY